jgi:CHAD domain-containing protein
MDAKSLLLESLYERWITYRAELQSCRKEFSEEAVHDLRVSTRRLLAALDLLRAVIRHPSLQKLHRVFKDHLNDLDELRDAQVLLADVSEFIQDVPNLIIFQKFLRAKEERLLRKAESQIMSLKTNSLTKGIEKAIGMLEGLSAQDINFQLINALDATYALVSQRYAAIEPSQPVTIHRLRLAFRKFRYMVESLYPLIDGFPADHLKRMHDYQFLMGALQDMEVALHQLKGLAEAQ